MADFAKAHTKTQAHEAGYANHRNDSGGETWAGIARVYHPHFLGWQIVERAKATLGLTSTVDASKAVRDALDKELRKSKSLAALVADFYKSSFWDKLRLDAEPDQLYAEKLYDVAVNMGDSRGADFDKRVREAVG